MSDFNTINTWVNTHLANNSNPTDITVDQLKELEAFADTENESLAKRVHQAQVNYSGTVCMQTLSSITLNNNRPYSTDYMSNAFAVVLLKPDPYSTDGLFTIVQIVPNRYVLKTIIRCDREYKTKSIVHTYFNMYKSDLTKQFVLTGTHGGAIQTRLFEHKAKHDNKERMDEEQEAGSNDAFTITQPDGTVVQP